MKVYDHMLDIVIAVVVLFLFPLLYFGQKQDAITQTVASAETTRFVDEIRSRGYLTAEMYDGFTEVLSRTGVVYDISIEHKKLLLEPEYRLRTVDEIKEEQDAAYTGSNFYTYWPVSTEVPAVNDPVQDGNLNTETNASVLASSVNTPASPSHVHSDACYLGTKHIHSGNPSSGGACYTYTPHTHIPSCYTTTYCPGTWTGDWTVTWRADQICAWCGYDSWGYTETGGTLKNRPPLYTWWCSNCDRMTFAYFKVVEIHQWNGICTVCSSGVGALDDLQGVVHGTTSKLTCGKTGEYILSCGKTEGLYYNGDTPVSPVCNQMVTNIVSTHPIQTVYVGDALITVIKATYFDGSTKFLISNTGFSTLTVGQNQTATLTLFYTVSGLPQTKTCVILVSVIPRNKTCVNGHNYHLNADGSDPGCPYCRNWLRNLTIENPLGGSISIYKGTTLAENGVVLLATYLDGRDEYLYSEYVDNLDMSYVGVQEVTLSYKGKNVTLTVTTLRNLVQCPVCGRYYELYPDGSDPGCPYEKALIPIFTGNVMKYYDNSYTEDILKELYDGSGVYYLSEQDYVFFTVKNSRKTFGEGLLSGVFHNLSLQSVYTKYGGYVREDGRY